MEPRAGEPLQRAAEDRPRPATGADHRARAGPDDPAHPGSAGDEVHQARADPERAPHEVLGPADVPGRARPAAGGVRLASPGPVSAGHQPRPLPIRLRRVPRGAARPEPEAACTASGSTGRRYNRTEQEHEHQLFKDWTCARVPARDHHRDPACEPVLRRLVRGELRQPRPLRRRDHLRAHPVPREEVPRDRRRVGAVHVRRIDGRLGSHGGPDLLPRRIQRGLDRLPRPHRFPRLHRGRPLQGQERVLDRRPVPAHAASGRARLSRPRQAHAGGGEPDGARPRHEEPVRPAVGHLGGGLLAGGGGRVPEADLGQAHRRHRSRGGGVLAREVRPRPHPAPRLEQGARAQARRASSTSTSATWTTTT